MQCTKLAACLLYHLLVQVFRCVCIICSFRCSPGVFVCVSLLVQVFTRCVCMCIVCSFRCSPGVFCAGIVWEGEQGVWVPVQSSQDHGRSKPSEHCVDSQGTEHSLQPIQRRWVTSMHTGCLCLCSCIYIHSAVSWIFHFLSACLLHSFDILKNR